MEMPEAVQWLLPIVVGESWPEGDEDKLRLLAEAWHQASSALQPVVQTGTNAVSGALANWTGQGALAVDEQWQKFVMGDDAYFKALTDASAALGNACEQTALDVEYTKYMIIISLIILAVQIASMVAAAFATFGASTAGIVPAQIATRVVVQQLFRQLLQKLAQQGFKQLAKELLEQLLKKGLKKIAGEVLKNVGMNLAMDVGIQGLQVLQGDRKEWDWSKTTDSAVGGAVQGAVGSVTGGLTGKLKSHGGDLGVVGKTVQGAVEGVATTVGQAAVTGELGNLSAGDVLTGAASGAAGAAVGAGKEHFQELKKLDQLNGNLDHADAAAPRPDSAQANEGSMSITDSPDRTETSSPAESTPDSPESPSGDEPGPTPDEPAETETPT
ncbi:NAD:arginine ADP-ribosyltransferase with a RelA/SpoT domain protein, partial [Amycolatopsis rhizosphaerae]